MKRVTSKDVARAAGVSQTTVSFVFNGRDDQGISTDTRDHVLATAAALGYVPSAAARSLRMGSSEVVLCLLPDLSISQETEEFKVELSRSLAEASLTCVYLHLAGNRHPLAELWRQVHPAVIVTFGQLSSADADAIRHAGIGLIEDILGHDSDDLIGIDQRELGRMQVRYLAAAGHRCIAYGASTDRREAPFCRPRLDGAREAGGEQGLPPIIETPVGDRASAASAIDDWHRTGVTAIAAFNDLTALRIIAQCRDQSISVPGDLAVMGIDNLPIAELSVPALTTISMNLAAAARRLACAVVELLGRDLPTALRQPTDHDTFRIVARESV
ncbi:LacI family DNA-binding transcriptional regulator [Gordonia sp. CPCC 205515]|uniref:LacI family DNA-binding transcriptional regulator n=1 Tax=Gordonia sp. CPCC 205515 TaxID=3140791 RepID=UPI003AF33E99